MGASTSTSSKRNNKRGFTIVELLIVIVVIAILAAIVIVAYQGIQARARDSRRSSDISDFKKLIELYKIDNGVYPPACGADDTGCVADSLASYLSPYTASIPHDPGSPGTYYSYVRGPVANNSYGLLVPNQSQPTCKTGNNVNANWWGTAVLAC